MNVFSFLRDRLEDVERTSALCKRRRSIEDGSSLEPPRRRTSSHLKRRLPLSERLRRRGIKPAAVVAPTSTKAAAKQLETHRWHRKRMFMRVEWDFWLSTKCCGGSPKASSGAARLHDASYIRAAEITTQDLSSHMDPSSWGRLESLALGGEEEILLFAAGAFPQQCLGPARVTRIGEARLWLWLHPAYASHFPQLDYLPLIRFSLWGAKVPAVLSLAHIDVNLRSVGLDQSCIPRQGPLPAASAPQAPSPTQAAPPSSFRVPKRRFATAPSPSSSPLFDRKELDALVVACPSTESINTARQEARKAGAGVAPPLQFETMPLLLVRRAQGGLVDLIVPHGYGVRLWVRLVLSGARVAGLQELEMHRLGLGGGLPSFPRDFPETEAGAAWWRARRQDWAARQALRPPSKRIKEEHWPLYPVHVDDESVSGSGSAQAQVFLVPRRRCYLAAILESDVPLPFPTLVPVLVVITRKGVLRDGALIFLAADEDEGEDEDEDEQNMALTLLGRATSGGTTTLRGQVRKGGLALVRVDALRGVRFPLPVLLRNPGSSVMRRATLSLAPSWD